MIIPHTAATIGTSASAGRASEPMVSSRLSSRPATKKKIVSRPSEAQCSRVSGPRWNSWTASYEPWSRLAHTRAMAAASQHENPADRLAP